MLSEIWSALKEVWDFLKKIWVKLVNFFINIVSWFKDSDRIRILEENKNTLALTLKEKLDSNEYKVINCLFNKNDNKIIDAQVITTDKLDKNTKEQFGTKEMIILE